MEFKLLTQEEKEQYYQTMLCMMEISDQDFVPPLSQRSSTTQKILTGTASTDVHAGLSSYLNTMMQQEILACLEDGKLLGFVSFIKDYTTDYITEADLPNIYLSTLILNPEARGRGITKQMYGHLFNDLYADRHIFTRTWSTNVPHIKILGYYNFAELARIPNHRGEGIDTVYYAKRRD